MTEEEKKEINKEGGEGSGASGAPPEPQNMQPTKEEMEGAPAGVKILAILFAIGGIMWLIYPLIFSYFMIFQTPEDLPFYQWASQMVCCWIGAIILASLYFGIAAGLIKGMKGAWVWALIFAIIGLFNVPIGTILSIIIIVYLFKVKDYFKH